MGNQREQDMWAWMELPGNRERIQNAYADAIRAVVNDPKFCWVTDIPEFYEWCMQNYQNFERTQMSTNAEKTKELAFSFLRAKNALNQSFNQDMKTRKPIADDLAWTIMTQFKQTIKEFVFDSKRGEIGLRQAARELYRMVRVDNPGWTIEDLYGFTVWYAEKVQKIGNDLADLFDFHGDSFGDLCDLMPLAGREIVEKILADKYKRERDLREDFREVPAEWSKFIYGGEQYMRNTLNIAAYQAFLVEVQQTAEERFPMAGYYDHCS